MERIINIRYFVAVFSAFFFAFIADSNAQRDTLQHALLWKIEGDSLEQPSYLYGTIHLIEGADFFYPKRTLEFFDRSENIVFEIDMNELQDPLVVFGLMNKAMMPDDISLRDLLDEEEYKMVQEHFAEIGLPLVFLERLKPMFLTVFASGDMQPGDLQAGEVKSYEFEFLERAQQQSKNISGLESLDFQLSVFDSSSYEDQADMLVESIAMGSTGNDMFREAVRLYRAQNINAMMKMMEGGEMGHGKYNDLLLGNRNRRWIAKMEELMEAGQSFFAVGAGHLGGDDGVIWLLRDQGYQVTPVLE